MRKSWSVCGIIVFCTLFAVTSGNAQPGNMGEFFTTPVTQLKVRSPDGQERPIYNPETGTAEATSSGAFVAWAGPEDDRRQVIALVRDSRPIETSHGGAYTLPGGSFSVPVSSEGYDPTLYDLARGIVAETSLQVFDLPSSPMLNATQDSVLYDVTAQGKPFSLMVEQTEDPEKSLKLFHTNQLIATCFEGKHILRNDFVWVDMSYLMTKIAYMRPWYSPEHFGLEVDGAVMYPRLDFPCWVYVEEEGWQWKKKPLTLGGPGFFGYFLDKRFSSLLLDLGAQLDQEEKE